MNAREKKRGRQKRKFGLPSQSMAQNILSPCDYRHQRNDHKTWSNTPKCKLGMKEREKRGVKSKVCTLATIMAMCANLSIRTKRIAFLYL